MLKIVFLYEIMILLNVLFIGSIMSLVYGLIDSENDASWTCFFEHFRVAHGVKR